MPADGPLLVMDSGSTFTLRAGGSRFKIKGWPPLVIGRTARSFHARSDTALVALAVESIDSDGTVDCAFVFITAHCVGSASGMPDSKGSNKSFCSNRCEIFPGVPS